MRALVVFHDNIDGAHPLSRFMKPGFWHCFACVENDGIWLRIDGEKGVPKVAYVTQSDGFDLAEFYREQGCTVIETKQRQEPVPSPFILRNCVGMVKAMLCIRSCAVTPWQLYRHLRNET
jgi:hypothetical protein